MILRQVCHSVDIEGKWHDRRRNGTEWAENGNITGEAALPAGLIMPQKINESHIYLKWGGSNWRIVNGGSGKFKALYYLR